MLRPILMLMDDGKKYTPHILSGYNTLVLPSDVQELITDLMDYCENYTDTEIEQINQQIIKQTNECIGNCKSNKTSKKSKSGYIYVLQCADKYKIGYSTNVEQRIRQLDTRPFKLNLLLKCYSDKAYDIEQELHKQLIEFRLEGEWYNEFLNMIDLKELIIEISEVLKCDIQF